MLFNIEQHGFALLAGVVDAATRQELVSAVGPCESAGRRGLLAVPAVLTLARSSSILKLVRPHLKSEPIPVRAIFFDKSPDANWFVAWHQDLTVAVRERVDVPGYGPGSVKNDIPHVQPPAEILEQMLTVRVHLDRADESNGALRVLPGTHAAGRLAPDQIQQLRDQVVEVPCVIEAGGVMLMRPLLLHASSRSTCSQNRRVVHIEYAACELPPQLAWHECA